MPEPGGALVAAVVVDRELQMLQGTIEPTPAACLCLPSCWWLELVFGGPEL